jgi:cytochrome P450
MTTATTELSALVQLEEPNFYRNPFPVYRRLRTESPVFWYEPRKVWALSRHEDVRQVSTKPQIFSTAHGFFLHDADRDISQMTDVWSDAGEQIGLTDPPRHTELRRFVAPAFTPRAVAKLQAATEEFCDRLVGTIEPGVSFNFVSAIASKLPMFVACRMLGLPLDNLEQVRRWSDQMESVAATGKTEEEMAAILTDIAAMNEYMAEQIEITRASPGDNLISHLLETQIKTDRLTDANVMMFVTTMLIAGNDTTRSMLSATAALLAQHPEQRLLVAGDRSLVPNALEESMRCEPPARGFIRRVMAETTVRGQELGVGDAVYLMYDAANRDEEVFEEPEAFDVTRRTSSQHLAFGYGTHACIGAPLVRMSTRALWERLLAQYPNFELDGDIRRSEASTRNGWEVVPIVCSRN